MKILKDIRKVTLAAILFGGGLWIGSMMISSADGLVDTNQPGSINDPVVTKSYVDQQIQKLVKKELEGVSKSSNGLVVVELNKGESLIAFEGTEFIVRNGKAIAFSKTTDGIPDLTDGKDIKKGSVIPNDHLLLFPRDDGRGIKPHEAETNTIFVMVRGDYQHLDSSGNEVK